MELAEFFASRSIEGLDPEEWLDILQGNTEGMHADVLSPGVIRITSASGLLNNKIMRCAKEYFTPNESGKKIRPGGTSAVLQCYKAKEKLGTLRTCGSFAGNCTQCHLACIKALGAGQLHWVVKRHKRS